MLAGEDVAGPAHVGGALVDLVEPAIDDIATIGRLAQIRDNEVVGLGFSVFRKLQIHAAHPKALTLQALHEVRSNKPSRTANQSALHDYLPSSPVLINQTGMQLVNVALRPEADIRSAH